MEKYRRILIVSLVFSALFLLFKGVGPTFQSKEDALKVIQKEEAKVMQEIKLERPDPRCQLSYSGDNPLPYDETGLIKLQIDEKVDLKGATAHFVGTFNGADVKKRFPFDLNKKEYIMKYDNDEIGGVYSWAIEVKDSKNDTICRTNVLKLSLPVLPTCEVRSDKSKYVRGEKMFFCFYDSFKLKKPIYDLEVYGQFIDAAGKKIDDITTALQRKEIEDRRFYDQRIVDLIVLPKNLKDGRGKICLEFNIPKTATVGTLKRWVYGLDGSKKENRICRSNDLVMQIVEK